MVFLVFGFFGFLLRRHQAKSLLDGCLRRLLLFVFLLFLDHPIQSVQGLTVLRHQELVDLVVNDLVERLLTLKVFLRPTVGDRQDALGSQVSFIDLIVEVPLLGVDLEQPLADHLPLMGELFQQSEDLGLVGQSDGGDIRHPDDQQAICLRFEHSPDDLRVHDRSRELWDRASPESRLDEILEVVREDGILLDELFRSQDVVLLHVVEPVLQVGILVLGLTAPTEGGRLDLQAVDDHTLLVSLEDDDRLTWLQSRVGAANALTGVVSVLQEQVGLVDVHVLRLKNTRLGHRVDGEAPIALEDRLVLALLGKGVGLRIPRHGRPEKSDVPGANVLASSDEEFRVDNDEVVDDGREENVLTEQLLLARTAQFAVHLHEGPRLTPARVLGVDLGMSHEVHLAIVDEHPKESTFEADLDGVVGEDVLIALLVTHDDLVVFDDETIRDTHRRVTERLRDDQPLLQVDQKTTDETVLLQVDLVTVVDHVELLFDIDVDDTEDVNRHIHDLGQLSHDRLRHRDDAALAHRLRDDRGLDASRGVWALDVERKAFGRHCCDRYFLSLSLSLFWLKS